MQGNLRRGFAIATLMCAPVAVALVAVSLTYVVAPVYRFAPPQAFTGATWYNPYANLDTVPGRWLKANFHAHSHDWGGLTNGAHLPAFVVASYRRLGYDVIGVSNYEDVSPERIAGTFPVYEHGWNVSKTHQLILGPRRVTWLDYPFGQGRDQRQHVLDVLHQNGALVALAHPHVRGAYTPEDLRYLAEYELLEVLNGVKPPADSEWDAALSSGHAMWLLADDDTHDADDSTTTGIDRTEIFARSGRTQDVIAALRAGRAFGVRGADSCGDLRLMSMEVRGDTVSVSIAGDVNDIRVIGQDGAVRYRVIGADAKRGKLSVTARPDDGYLRVVARGPHTLLYTNPVIRWNGHDLPRGKATVDWPRTIGWRLGWLLVYGWLGWLAVGLIKRVRRRGTRTREPMQA